MITHQNFENKVSIKIMKLLIHYATNKYVCILCQIVYAVYFYVFRTEFYWNYEDEM